MLRAEPGPDRFTVANNLKAAVTTVRLATQSVPEVAVIAGSGLSGLSEHMADAVAVPYDELAGWPTPTVTGHVGELVIGEMGGRTVAVARGRVHLYEGYHPREIVYGLQVMHALGAETLVVTNAAGGLNPDYAPGNLMLIADHLFLPGFAGANPLVGPNDDEAGPRFPTLVDAYDARLRRSARAAAAERGLDVHEGVYAMVVGPSFETPAEARFLRSAGADVVGMSTVPEVIVARHRGLRVLGISLVTNTVPTEIAELGQQPAADVHDEVTAVGAAAAADLAAVIAAVVADL